jgi:hypothetical protein
VGHLAESIHNNKDSVESIGLWKFHNEVHADGCPTLAGDWQGLEKTMGFVLSAFGSGTSVT